ncbi:unnamed protein product, partial [Mesorhabditis spiculigera]
MMAQLLLIICGCLGSGETEQSASDVQVVEVDLQNSSSSTASGSAPAKRSVATSPIRHTPVRDLDEVSVEIEVKPLLPYDAYKSLPDVIWLAIMKLFTPLDLLNLAGADQYFKYGVGPDWRLPAPEQYKTPPSIRAHTAMLQVKGPKDDLIAQLASMDPFCVAMHADPTAITGTFSSEVKKVTTFMPRLKKLWLGLGSNISELSVLAEILVPNLAIYISLVKQKDSLNPTALFKLFLETLGNMIGQWERGEREIGLIFINSHRNDGECEDWSSTPLDPSKLAEVLCKGKSDARQIDVFVDKDADPLPSATPYAYFVIRRHESSSHGLVVACLDAKIVLASCDYNFRRTRSWRQRNAYVAKCCEAENSIRRAYDGNRTDYGRCKERLRVSRRCAAEAEKHWLQTMPDNTIPTRELTIDRLLEGWYPLDHWQMFSKTPDFSGARDPILMTYLHMPMP